MRLRRIAVFPIKSLDPVDVAQAVITSRGILENDRVYAIFDRDGRVVNGKRTAQMQRLRCSFDPDIEEVCLWETDHSSAARFSLSELEPIQRWLSDFFGFPVELRHEPESGFPDDPVASGPTIVSEASLRVVQKWYDGWSLDSVRRRFRTNLEVEGGEAFCEDVLFGGPDELKPFRIGVVAFHGHNPCQRCVVPSRDPDSGEAHRGFQQSFAERREQHLPRWSDARRFNHFYRFAVNTSIPATESGKRLRVGDTITLGAGV
jgi:uncharacterized protein YcbX